MNHLLEALRPFPQFVVHNGDKVPRRAADFINCDVTDSRNWATYDAAAAAIQSKDGYGIGFALSPNDPFTCIDLDVDKGQQQTPFQKEIFDAFADTYSELSPSGRGCHIWCKGSVETIKRPEIEIYSRARYITFTDNPINNLPLLDRQSLLERLTAHLNNGNGTTVPTVFDSQPETQSDDEILRMASTAQNAYKFIELWEGRWQQFFPEVVAKGQGPSEADQALCNIIAFYTDSKSQVLRLFLQSALGKREKNHRFDIQTRLINKAFDKKVAEVEGVRTFAITSAAGLPPKTISFPTNTVSNTINTWPAPLSEAAYHGLAGDFVRMISPASEADPAALLLTFLTGVGCLFGRKSHLLIEDTRHHTNLFTVLVGATAKARKGTGTDRTLNLLKLIDPDFYNKRLFKGLTSGEGLVHFVRDAKPAQGTAPADPGVADKRTLVVESEFAQVLAMSSREGNTLGIVLRDAWDGTKLQVMARSNKDVCLNPHISVIGNITFEELAKMKETDKANGFANRFMFVCVDRSKKLPHGGKIDFADLNALATRIYNAVLVTENRNITLDADAYELWPRAYDTLTDVDRTGAFAKVTTRSAPIVRRLAMIYALLDRSPVVRKEHLFAAMEVWRYCDDSARTIYGDATGNATVDTIYKTLISAGASGVTRSQVRDLFNRNKTSQELTSALALLERNGKARKETTHNTGGRPIETWYCIQT